MTEIYDHICGGRSELYQNTQICVGISHFRLCGHISTFLNSIGEFHPSGGRVRNTIFIKERKTEITDSDAVILVVKRTRVGITVVMLVVFIVTLLIRP